MRTLATSLLVLTVLVSIAQSSDDAAATTPNSACRDAYLSAFPTISELYKRGDMDSIYSFLDYWESKCGTIEDVYRLRTILDIKTGAFNSNDINSGTIMWLADYKTQISTTGLDSGIPPDVLDLLLRYDGMTRTIAGQTISRNEDEFLILDFYSSGLPTFEKIKLASEETRLKQAYYSVIRSADRMPEFHAALITGLVQYFGQLYLFGDRPTAGLVVGVRKTRHYFDALLDFRIGPSRYPYSFVYDDSLVTERSWTAVYAGVEYTYDFVQRERRMIGLTAGIGSDDIMVAPSGAVLVHYLNGFNKNVGVAFKFKFRNSYSYWGIHIRYNWVNYKNKGGTPLDGQYLNIRLIMGRLRSVKADDVKQRLR